MIGAFIPIKSRSERITQKNFSLLGNKKLYEYMISSAIESKAFDDIFVDTDSNEIKTYALSRGIKVIDRLPELAGNDANGNDLLVYHRKIYPEYNYYVQLFVTAPFLQPKTIKKCVFLLASSAADSVLTVTNEVGWFWKERLPINFRPGILPRSQDSIPLVKETTGLYGISAFALDRYNCRTGSNPLFIEVSKKEAMDIDELEDLEKARNII